MPEAPTSGRDENGQTPLHVAAFYGGEARVVLFLNHGAEIDARDATGRTPLHCAASLGRLEEATSLVSRGADVSLLDHEGRTPLDLVRDMDLLREDYREPLERLLAGFITVKIVEARPDSLILQVESLHVRFSDAERVATERGTLTIPAALLHDVPEAGELIQCRKGLSPVLDEAWSEARGGISASSRCGDDERPLVRGIQGIDDKKHVNEEFLTRQLARALRPLIQ